MGLGAGILKTHPEGCHAAHNPLFSRIEDPVIRLQRLFSQGGKPRPVGKHLTSVDLFTTLEGSFVTRFMAVSYRLPSMWKGLITNTYFDIVGSWTTFVSFQQALQAQKERRPLGTAMVHKFIRLLPVGVSK
jgi:hypothetical protein